MLAVAGTFVPLALIAVAMVVGPFAASFLMGIAGALALVAGWCAAVPDA